MKSPRTPAAWLFFTFFTFFSCGGNFYSPLSNQNWVKETLPETEVTFSIPTIRSDNGKAVLMVRNLCDHLLDLNMYMLDNRNITGKHLGHEGLHLNKVGSTRLAKNIIYKLENFNGIRNT